MLKKLTLTLLGCFLFIFTAIAGQSAGGQVTYRYLGNYKFEVKYKVYRDCRGIPNNLSSYTIRCASTNATKTLKSTRISIEDITPFCTSAGKPCNPSNTTAGNGFEEHTYLDTLDFNGTESAFKSCCIIQIGIGECCRNGGITTGSGNQNFWVFSTLDLCNAATNSSPVFSFKPLYIHYTNEPLMLSYIAKDTIDNDSLSYSFTDPMQDWNTKTSWTSGLDSKNPFTAYYPSGYNKTKGPKPDNNPPIGIYLNPITGNLIGTFINASEATILAISVKEWRKDNTGKYIQIGEIIIDQMFYSITGYNHQPSINQQVNHKICEGQNFTIDITPDDYPFNQVPPAANILNDTVKITWDKGIKNASYTIANSSVKLPVGRFSWTPATGDSKKLPFMFSVIATDNACPRNGITIKTFSLTVYPKINVSSTIKKVNNYTYTAGINVSNKKYNYVSGIFITSSNQEDTRNYYFKSSNNVYSSLENDTLVFKKNGTYVINTSFISETECNSTTVQDTIKISNILELNLGIDAQGIYTDTSLCQNLKTRLRAKVINAKRPVTYNWKTKTNTLTDTMGYYDQSFAKDDTLFLSIKDANNNTNSTYRAIKVLSNPAISSGLDKIVCPDVLTKLKGKNSNTGILSWNWYKDSKNIGSTDSIDTYTAGTYITGATNANGCTTFDTIVLTNYKLTNIDLISRVYCQEKKEINQSEIFKFNPNEKFTYINWSLLKTLPKPTGNSNFISDLLFDNDPTSKYDYNIRFDDSRIFIQFTNKDSLVLKATAIDTNGCFNTDTMTITIIKKPFVSIVSSIITKCMNQALDMNLYGNSNGTHKWIPINRNGFATWTSAPKGDSLLTGTFTKPGSYKIKLEATIEICTASDSLIINALQLPKPVITVTFRNPSVIFKDFSTNIKSRKWFINNILYSTDDSLAISRTFAHMQPIRLELTDNIGCTKDTTIIMNTLGISKIKSSKIEVYPNPANTFLVLKQLDTWVPSTFEIFNVLGIKVISGITKSKEEQIDLLNLKPGPYYLKYTTEVGTVSIAFIKSE